MVVRHTTHWSGRTPRRPMLDEIPDEPRVHVFPVPLAWNYVRHDVIGGGDCWCGGRFGHDWPGRLDGAPHPR